MAGCDSCSELHIAWEIRSPGELRKAIRVVGDNLDDGTLVETSGRAPFHDLREGGGFPDIVHHAFRCATCGASFTLSAETYHGSGGAWRPDDDGGEKEPR